MSLRDMGQGQKRDGRKMAAFAAVGAVAVIVAVFVLMPRGGPMAPQAGISDADNTPVAGSGTRSNAVGDTRFSQADVKHVADSLVGERAKSADLAISGVSGCTSLSFSLKALGGLPLQCSGNGSSCQALCGEIAGVVESEVVAVHDELVLEYARNYRLSEDELDALAKGIKVNGSAHISIKAGPLLGDGFYMILDWNGESIGCPEGIKPSRLQICMYLDAEIGKRMRA